MKQNTQTRFHLATNPATCLLVAILSLFALAPMLQAQINYQGHLTDSNGGPENGTRSLTFNLYATPTGGGAVWGPRTVTAEVVDGFFNVIIPSADTTGGDLLQDHLSGTRYLGIKVGAATEISPRQQVLATPKALNAVEADHAKLADNATNAGHATTADTATNFTSNVLFTREANGSPEDSTNNGTERVGIGTGTPKDKLHIFGATPDIRITNTAETYSGIAFEDSGAPEDGTGVTPIQFAAIRYSSGDGNLGFFNVDPVTPKVVIKNTGKVGIGATNPGYPLVVVSDTELQLGLSTSPSVGIFPQFGARRKSLVLGYNLGGDYAEIASAHEGNELKNLVINVKNVGIGTTTPTKGKLHVEGFQPAAIGNHSRYDTGTPSGVGATTVNTSIYASHDIVGGTFRAFSDARIKNVQGRSDTARDLAMLLGIEVTDYTMIDTVEKGSGTNKKVIAQQVEKFYPQAVSQSTDEIPDIYQKATVEGGWVELATDLKVGERVKLIGEKEEGVHEVIEVREGAFRTAFKPTTKKVFVYGREVDDFRSVDYEAIAMLNVSATQQIKKEKDAEVKALQEENSALRASLAAQEKQLAAQDKRLASLEAKDKGRDAKLARLEKYLDAPALIKPVNASLHQ